VIGLGSLYRMAAARWRRAGGAADGWRAGAEDTTDLNLRRLRNVVEEIAIASGVPVPKVYVLEHESAINAFAAGYAPADAVIAVTRGALERLNRDELQGVIAHEFSHILNGDMRLNIRLIGVLFGILMLGLIGRKVLV
jgi:Zn-dependent protease with chaperone function